MDNTEMTNILNSAVKEMDAVVCSGYSNHVHIARAIEYLALAIQMTEAETESSDKTESEEE